MRLDDLHDPLTLLDGHRAHMRFVVPTELLLEPVVRSTPSHVPVLPDGVERLVGTATPTLQFFGAWLASWAAIPVRR